MAFFWLSFLVAGEHTLPYYIVLWKTKFIHTVFHDSLYYETISVANSYSKQLQRQRRKKCHLWTQHGRTRCSHCCTEEPRKIQGQLPNSIFPVFWAIKNMIKRKIMPRLCDWHYSPLPTNDSINSESDLNIVTYSGYVLWQAEADKIWWLYITIMSNFYSVISTYCD